MEVSSSRLLLLLLVVASLTIHSSSATIVDIMDTCCNLGVQWYTQSRRQCGRYYGNLNDVTPADQDNCTSLVQVCCLGEKQRQNCDIGKQFAKVQNNCQGLERQAGGDDAKECCSCCRLGRAAKQQGLPCSLFHQYGTQCGNAFQECCYGDELLTQAVTTTTPANTGFPEPGGSFNMCEQFAGELCAHICISVGASYRCECHQGFELQSDSRTCKQKETGDRCDHTNPCQHQCVDTGLAIHCRCFEGFALQVDGTSCKDVDECAEGNFHCAHGQSCKNTEGGYACVGTTTGGGGGGGGNGGDATQCSLGFAYNRLARQCEDIDECTISRHTCLPTEDCYNTQGSFRCFPRGVNPGEGSEEGPEEAACPPGYVYNRATAICEDVNECLTDTHNCQNEHQVCRNTYGSHTCSCQPGFQLNIRTNQCEDINECALGHAACINGQICENTLGSYHCRRSLSCGTGYTVDRETQACVDDDECRLGTHNCGVARECTNVPGSFRCVDKECPPGYKLDYRSGDCEVVNCPRGMKADPAGNCVDMNECVERPGVCRPNQECQNTPGSYICRNLVNCGTGFELNEAGNRCQDIDECARGTHECNGPRMTCLNRPGTYMCQCPEGYQMDSARRICEDINECEKFGSVCSVNAECQNTQGSFRCICKTGFESYQDGRTCRDIDECERPGMCQHKCRNTWGSFQCTCFKGYKIAEDKRRCIDIDECSEWQGSGNLCVGLCQNTPGSFTCACPDGYNLLNDGRTCQDINECQLGTANCNGADDICINTRGSYKCQTVTCPKGFVKAPSVNSRNSNVRCQRRSFVCPQGDTECLYAPLSYSMNFMSFPSGIRIPADLFTMRVPPSPYRRLDFELKLISSQDPRTGESRVSDSFFQLEQPQNNEAVVQLLQEVDGPQDIELQLDMNIYSKEFAGGEELFFGTAVAKITVFVTEDPWISAQEQIEARQSPPRQPANTRNDRPSPWRGAGHN